MPPSSRKPATDKPTLQNDEHNAQQSRTVHFSLETKVRHVPKVNKDEMQAFWLIESDYGNIQMGILKTVKRMRQGKLNQEKYCIRGLEHMATSSHIEQRKKDKETIRYEVLCEQNKQRLSGIYDPISICRVSLALSKKSRDTALSFGASDAAISQEENESLFYHSQHINMASSQDTTSASYPLSQAEVLRKLGVL